MNRLRLTIVLGIVLGALLCWQAAEAAMPWVGPGTAVPTAPAGTASPTCTSFAFAPVCILNMTANITSLGISGDPGAGTNHQATLILQQDGTGGRTLPSAVASLSSTLLPSPASTAASKYTAYVLQYNTTTNRFTVVNQYDNYPVANFDYTNVQAVAAQTIAPTAAAAQPTIIAPGMTVNNTCSCVPNQALNGAASVYCLPETNAIQCVEANNSGATITATTLTMQVRGLP